MASDYLINKSTENNWRKNRKNHRSVRAKSFKAKLHFSTQNVTEWIWFRTCLTCRQCAVSWVTAGGRPSPFDGDRHGLSGERRVRKFLFHHHADPSGITAVARACCWARNFSNLRTQHHTVQFYCSSNRYCIYNKYYSARNCNKFVFIYSLHIINWEFLTSWFDNDWIECIQAC